MSYLFRDINKKILEEIEKNYKDINLSIKSKIFTGVFIKYIESNFFRGKYDNLKAIEINSGDNLYYRVGYSQNKSDNIYDYFGKISPFIKEIEKFENISNKKIVFLEENKDVDFIIDKLKNSNNFFNNVFETNEIKLKIIEEKKKDVSVEIYENLSFSDLRFIIKEENFTDKKDLKNYLTFNCGINFLDLDKKGIYFIFKNEDSIAGVALLVDNNFYNLNESQKENINNPENYKYMAYVNVSKEFRGLGIGIKLIEEAYKYCEKNNFIYISSDYTDDGSKYLADKKNDLNEKYKDKIVIIDQKTRKRKELLISKESSKGSDFETIKKSLMSNSSLKIKTP